MNDAYFTAGDGCRIAYRLEGSEDLPILVLSNSIATNLSMWDDQIEEFTKTFRVLRYDMRGHGRSDAPAGAYSLDRFGRDVIELLDGLKIERAHFCGLSLGGFVGQWLGIHTPERIDRLILSNTAPYLGPAPQWDELIRTVREAPDLSEIADMFIGNWFPADMRGDGSEVAAKFRAMVLATPPQGLAGSFALVRDSDLRRTISLIEAPTLVIGGENDTVTAASHSAEIAKAIPGAKLVLLPGVHMLNIEHPRSWSAAIFEFLG